MILLDVNILLYAYDRSAPNHKQARRWVESAFSGPETVILPWITIWAFLRIGTNARLQRRPFIGEEAFSIIESWLELDNVVVANPGPRHAALLQRLVLECQASGPLLTDAALAALALEQGASLVSTDHDFSRFPVEWINPLSPQPS